MEKEPILPAGKLALIVLVVMLAAAATMWLAFQVGGDLQPGWMAALGPLLLIATLVAHFQRKNRK